MTKDEDVHRLAVLRLRATSDNPRCTSTVNIIKLLRQEIWTRHEKNARSSIYAIFKLGYSYLAVIRELRNSM